MQVDFDLITKIAVFLINAIGLWLILIVYFSDKERNIKKSFISTTLFMLIWVDFAYIARLPSQVELALFWIRIAWAVTIPLFASIYFFTIYFLNEHGKHRLTSFIVLITGIVSFPATLLTNWAIADIQSKQVWSKLIYGYGIIVFYAIVLLISFLTLKLLFKNYFSSKGKERDSIQYFVIGILFFLTMNVVFNIIYPFILNIPKYYQLGDYSTVVFLGFLAYAITKHDLMGIKTFLTQILITVMSIILLIDIVILSSDDFMRMLKIGILITFLYFSRELVRSVKKEKNSKVKLQNANKKIKHYVDKLEDTNKNLEEGNKDLKALLEVNDKVMENFDPKEIAQSVVDIIPDSLGHLGNKGGIFILFSAEKKEIYTYAITNTTLVKKAEKLLNKSFYKHKVNINDIDNLVARTIKEKKSFVSTNLSEFLYPTVGKKSCSLIQKVVKAKSFISMPIFSRRDVIGLLIFVGTKPVNKILQRDKNILYMFSSHVGNAMENARLYEQTSRQIKETKKLNNNLEIANTKLKELLEIKNEFLHITSHQLRTPLTAIRGMVSMWYDGDFDDLSAQEKNNMIKKILVSTDRLNNITNDMLDALELEGGFLKFQFQSISLKKMLQETIDTLKGNFDKKGLYLRLKFDSKTTDIEVEPNYIRQVFMNTIDNACKYTKKGGVDINVKKNKDHLEIIIKDTGVGISKEDQKRLFQKFTRGKNASVENASGSGLGLFIARKIIRAHDGEIEISSDGINRGSVVKIFLKIKHN
ncbi:hypothetical protein KAJ41_01970 [Candidatus Parcubacteria bacterium]|nr:hypothetical protein [Candidatus Parcubacteria bacterium]